MLAGTVDSIPHKQCQTAWPTLMLLSIIVPSYRHVQSFRGQLYSYAWWQRESLKVHTGIPPLVQIGNLSVHNCKGLLKVTNGYRLPLCAWAVEGKNNRCACIKSCRGQLRIYAYWCWQMLGCEEGSVICTQSTVGVRTVSIQWSSCQCQSCQ